MVCSRESNGRGCLSLCSVCAGTDSGCSGLWPQENVRCTVPICSTLGSVVAKQTWLPNSLRTISQSRNTADRRRRDVKPVTMHHKARDIGKNEIATNDCHCHCHCHAQPRQPHLHPQWHAYLFTRPASSPRRSGNVNVNVNVAEMARRS
jgi:hypothetical protein